MAVSLPLTQHNNKRGDVGAWEPMFTMPTVPSQTLTTQSDHEGAEARETTHYTSDR
jgi:hypothetical protein